MSVSDNFNRANANPVGSPWTTISGFSAMQISSNSLIPAATSTNAGCVETVHSWGSSQTSQATITSTGSGDGGLALCMTPGTANGYACVGSSESKIFRIDGGSFTLLDSGGSGWGGLTNATVVFAKSGSTLTVTVNGSLEVTTTDSTYSTGSPGFYNFGTGNTFDDWVGTGEATSSYTLTAAQGSYALSGQAAGLLYSRIMAAVQGSYALTGQAAGLSYGVAKTIVADQGSYNLTGSAALVDNGMNADFGQYNLTGFAANLVYTQLQNYSITAIQGQYNLTGIAAGVTLNRILTAVQGQYNLSGGFVNLLWSGAPVVIGSGNNKKLAMAIKIGL